MHGSGLIFILDTSTTTNTGRDPLPDKPRQRGFFRYMNATAENLQATLLDNPQCLFLARSLDSWKKPPSDLSWDECEAAYETFRQDFDWIGTTDQLSSVTLPFLTKLADQARHSAPPTIEPESSGHSNQSPVHLARSTLSETEVDKIRQRTSWDRELYDRVMRDFDAKDLVLP